MKKRTLIYTSVFCFHRPIDQDEIRESAVREYIRREGEEPAEEDIYIKDKCRPPRFKTSIKCLELKERDTAHFECKLVPLGDPKMNVEWFKDNEPLQHGRCLLLF